METIRKKICFDKLISHRNGITPYISKDTDDIEIKYVTTISSESNYGSFPCDFVLNRSEYYMDTETGLNTRKNTEISRLKYLDVLRWYNDVNEFVKEGKILKRIPYDYENVNHVNCSSPSDPMNNCGISSSSTTESTIVESSLWQVDTTNDKLMYECILVDFSLLSEFGNGIYEYEKSNTIRYKTITENSLVDFEDLSDDDKNFVEKMNYFVIGSGNIDDVSSYNGVLFTLGDNDRIFAINKYPDYLNYEKYWNSWWEENWPECTNYSQSQRWEKYVLDQNYEEPLSLKFIYDFEKYILGKVLIPEKYNGELIDGSKVPNAVFYLNYMNYLTWFNNNSEYLDSNDDLQREWEKRGGDNFKTFLENITPKFIELPTIPENQTFVYFDFVVPNIDIDLAFIDEFYNEYSYVPYEYSVGIDGELVDATIEYEKGKNNRIESALTPTFVDFTDSGITVESKLTTLYSRGFYYISDDIYGVFEEFPNGGKLFKCKFYQGNSSADEIINCSSGSVNFYSKVGNDEWNLVKTISINESENSIQQHESLPNANGAYQVVGIKEIGSSVTITETNSFSSTTYSLDGTLKTVSAITNYNKSISKFYRWCECYTTNAQGIECGDGEDGDFSTNGKYRNLLLLSCVPDAVEDDSTGKEYYYMIKYDNGYTGINNNSINSKTHPKPLKLPMTLEKRNIESYDGEFSGTVKYDKITNVTIVDDNTKVIEYVIGATEGEPIETSGIHYVDTYHYYGNVFADVVIDGYYKAQVLYEKISSDEESAYSEDFDASRNYVQSKIIGMEIGTQWTPESSLRAYLYTDDSYDNLIEYPKIDVDITFNRGNAAAWESHFKLSECNTFEDLQNYGNNYFNL